LIITSPPYDSLRNYNGYSFDFENIAKGLFKVLKEGGVAVWVVGDKINCGRRSELMNSFLILYFRKIDL
jgi:site-specific DNA-methyltransferase (adenine-specific)